MTKQEQALRQRLELAFVQLAEIPVAYRGMAWQGAAGMARESLASLDAGERFKTAWALWKEARSRLADACL